MFLVFLFAILSFMSKSQDQPWQRINPIPTESNLNEVIMLDDGIVMAVGSLATIITSDDFGESWELQLQPAGVDREVNFTSIFFLDDQTGWITGSYQTLLKTNDGGQSWFAVNKGTNHRSENYNDVLFFNEQTGLLVGGNLSSFLLRTTDGGENWDTVSPGQNAVFTHLSFVENEAVYLSGTDGKYYFRSIDFGENWVKVSVEYPNNEFKVLDMVFLNADTAFINGRLQSLQFLFKTTDGGGNWYKVFQSSENWINSICFSDDLNGYAASTTYLYTNNILSTSDGGENWVVSHNSIGRWNMHSICSIDANSASMVGDHGQIFKTVDAGLNWFLVSTNTTYNYALADAAITADSIIVAIGSGGAGGVVSGSLIRSTDRGKAWLRVNIPMYQLTDVSFVNDTLGYLSESFDILRKTINAGESWEIISSLPIEIKALYFFDEHNGLITGPSFKKESYFLYQTENGGQDWQLLDTLPVINEITDMEFVDDSLGYITGLGPNVLKSSDRGQSWDWDTLPVNNVWLLKGIEVLNPDTFFIYGDANIVRTTDGGITWNNITPEVKGFINFEKLDFVNQTAGYAVATGHEETLFKTTDLGESWEALDIECTSDLYSVAFFDKYEGLVMGDHSVIFRTETGGTVFTPEFDARKDSEQNWTVWPNPFSQQLNLLSKTKQTTKVELRLYDINGKSILSRSFPAGTGKISWNTGSLPTGVYFLKLSSGGRTESHKVVKNL